MVPRRGRHHHWREETLVVARRRSAWLRPRRSGPKPPRCQSCQAVDAQASERARFCPARYDHRQASILWCGEAGDHARRRASFAQGPEQSGGEFSSTYPATGEDHEAVQVTAPTSALRLNPRPDRQPLPNSSPRHAISPLSRAARGRDEDVERDRPSSGSLIADLVPYLDPRRISLQCHPHVCLALTSFPSSREGSSRRPDTSERKAR